MNNQTTQVSTHGVSALSLLGVAFVVLKLTGFLDWSWWWVTLPFWGGAALVIALVALFFAGLGIAMVFDVLRDTRAKRKRVETARTGQQ